MNILILVGIIIIFFAIIIVIYYTCPGVLTEGFATSNPSIQNIASQMMGGGGSPNSSPTSLPLVVNNPPRVTVPTVESSLFGTSTSETIPNVSGMYYDDNFSTNNLELGNGVLLWGPAPSTWQTNLGLYSTVNGEPINFVTNGGAVNLSTVTPSRTNPFPANAQIGSTNSLVVSRLYTPSLCVGNPNNVAQSTCITYDNGQLNINSNVNTDIVNAESISSETANVSGTINISNFLMNTGLFTELGNSTNTHLRATSAEVTGACTGCASGTISGGINSVKNVISNNTSAAGTALLLPFL